MEKDLRKMGAEELGGHFSDIYGGTVLGWTSNYMQEAERAYLGEMLRDIKDSFGRSFSKGFSEDWRAASMVWLLWNGKPLCRLELTTDARSEEPMEPCVIFAVEAVCPEESLEKAMKKIRDILHSEAAAMREEDERIISLYRCLITQETDTPEKLGRLLDDMHAVWDRLKDDPRVKKLFG